MTTFQIILISILGCLGLFGAISGFRRSIGRPAAVIILIISLAGISAALDPNQTTRIARAIGISRGTDLIVYLVALVVFQGFVVFYLRLRKVRRELTLLVRHLAILEASSGDGRGRIRRNATEAEASDP
jgi:small membrane protein